MTKTLTVGTYDTPHFGHARFLYLASQIGDELVVGVNTDSYVETYKGKKPVFSFEERSRIIASAPYVTRVIPNDQDSLRPMILVEKPQVLVIGSDWGERYYEQADITPEWLNAHKVVFIVLPYTKDISSTILKERLYE